MPDKIVVRDWGQLQAFLQPPLRQRHYRYVSLDIFDTLLARIETPEQVQRSVCRLLAKRLRKLAVQCPASGQAYTAEQVWQTRQQAEQALRQQAVESGYDYECRFSELVPVWLQQLVEGDCDGQAGLGVGELGTVELAELNAFVIQTEMELEQLALYVKPGVSDLLQWLSGFGIRLFALSDMYLDGGYVRSLLAAKGLLQYFEQVYVSADSLLCKYSGRLFIEVGERHALDYAAWTHIGDNPVSDRRAACRVGIQGIWLYEKAEQRRLERQVLTAKMAQRGSIWAGRHFFSVLEQRLRMHETASEDFYFCYGRDVLGTAFSTFTLGLQERLQCKPADKVFFVARDGYLFQQMYQQLEGDKPEDEYIYLSRKVITAASTAAGLTREQAQVAFYNPKQQGLRSVCKVYGLSEAELAPLALQHGFADFAEPVRNWHDPRLLDFLADERVQACVRPQGLEHRALLEDYLEQMGFFAHARVALVDIGWNGTVQKFLKEAFGHRADFPEVNMYYFAFVPKMYSDFGKQNFAEGIIHDSRRDNACERIPAEFEEIFEQGARALEATTVGYRRVKGAVEPVLKSGQAPDRRAELACNRMVDAMQAGALQHWAHFRAVQRLTGYSSVQLLPYVYGVLERAVVYPTREESRQLTRLVHTEDFGHDHVLELGKRSLGWRDVLRPQEVWQRIQQSAWRYALFASIPTSLANFAFRVVYLHAVKK